MDAAENRQNFAELTGKSPPAGIARTGAAARPPVDRRIVTARSIGAGHNNWDPAHPIFPTREELPGMAATSDTGGNVSDGNIGKVGAGAW